MLDKDTALRALRRLAELARERHVQLSLTIYGGTVMMLAYNARPGTKDIDAIFRPRDEVAPLVEQVSREMDLTPGWLNDEVKMWVAENEQDALVPFSEMADAIPGVSVKRPSAKYLLAMKARAARLPLPGQTGDYHDLVFLLRHTRTMTLEAVDALVERHFLQDCLTARSRAIVAAALKDAHPPP